MKALDVINGQATWSIERADALDWLRTLPEKSVDLIFGSPPYEECRSYLEDGQNLGIARKTDEWVAWMTEVFVAAQAASKGLVAMVVAGQTRKFRWSAGPALLMASLRNAGLNLRNPPIFKRVGIPGSGGPDWLRNDYEWIVCTTQPGRMPWSNNKAMGHKPKWALGGEISHRKQDGGRVNEKRKIFRHNDDGSGKVKGGHDRNICDIANPGNIIQVVVGGGTMGDEECHLNEAPFPEKLAEFFVLSFAPEGGIVADCFSGSGTTAKVAVANGRRAIACDLRASQVELGKRRLGKTTLPLFA